MTAHIAPATPARVVPPRIQMSGRRTRKATRIVVSTLGAVVGMAGIEHGIGEILQGNVAPEGVAFLSWPDTEIFRIVGGEPAMSIVPNLLMTGILAVTPFHATRTCRLQVLAETESGTIESGQFLIDRMHG